MAERFPVEPGSAEFTVTRLTTRGRLCPHNPKLVSSANSGVPSCLGFFYQTSRVILLLKTSCLCKTCYDQAAPNGYNVYCGPSAESASRDFPDLESGIQWWQFRPVGLEIYGLSELIRLPLPTSSDDHRTLQLFSAQCRPFYMSLFHTMGKFVPESATDKDIAITASYGNVYRSFGNEVGSMARSPKLEVKVGVKSDLKVGGTVDSTQVEVNLEVNGNVKENGIAARNTSTWRAKSTIQVEGRETFEAETRKGPPSNGQVSTGAGSNKSEEASSHPLDQEQAYQGRLQQQQLAEPQIRSVATSDYKGIGQQQRVPNRHNSENLSLSVPMQTLAMGSLMVPNITSHNIQNPDLVSELNIKTKREELTAGAVQPANPNLRTLSNSDSGQQPVMRVMKDMRQPVQPITWVPRSSAKQGTFQAGSTLRDTRGPLAKEDPRSKLEILGQPREDFSGMGNGSTKTPSQFNPTRQEKSFDNLSTRPSADPRSNRVPVSMSPLAVGGQVPSGERWKAPALLTGGKTSDPLQRTSGPAVKTGGLSAGGKERPELRENFDPRIISRHFGDPANPLQGAGPGHRGNNSGALPNLNRGINPQKGIASTYGPSVGGTRLPGQFRVAVNAQGGRTLGDMPDLMSEKPRINRDIGLNTFSPSSSKPKGGLLCQPRNGASIRGTAAVPNLISNGPNVTRGQGLSDLKPPISTPKTDWRPQPMNSGRIQGAATGSGRGMPGAVPNLMSGRPKAVPDQGRNDFRPPNSMPKTGPNMQTMTGPQLQRNTPIPNHQMPFQSNQRHMPTMPGMMLTGQHQRGLPPMSNVMHIGPHRKGFSSTYMPRPTHHSGIHNANSNHVPTREHHEPINHHGPGYGHEKANDVPKSDKDIDKKDKEIGELAVAVEELVDALKKDHDQHPDPELELEPKPAPESDTIKNPDPDPEPEPSPEPNHDSHPVKHLDKDTTHPDTIEPPSPKAIEHPDPDSNNSDPIKRPDHIEHPETSDLEPIEHLDPAPIDRPDPDLSPVEHLDANNHPKSATSEPDPDEHPSPDLIKHLDLDPAEHLDTAEHPDSGDASLIQPTDNFDSHSSRDIDNGGERQIGAEKDVNDPISHSSEPLHLSEDHNGLKNHDKSLALADTGALTAASLEDLDVSDGLPHDEHANSQDIPSNDGDNYNIHDDYPEPWEDNGDDRLATQDPNEDEPSQAKNGWGGDETAASLPSDPGEEVENRHLVEENETEHELPQDSDLFDNNETHSLPAGPEEEAGDIHFPQELETENDPSSGGFFDPDEVHHLPADTDEENVRLPQAAEVENDEVHSLPPDLDEEVGDMHLAQESEIESEPSPEDLFDTEETHSPLPDPDEETGYAHFLLEHGIENGSVQDNVLFGTDDTRSLPSDPGDTRFPNEYDNENEQYQDNGLFTAVEVHSPPSLAADDHTSSMEENPDNGWPLDDKTEEMALNDESGSLPDAQDPRGFLDEGDRKSNPGDEDQNALFGDPSLGMDDADIHSESKQDEDGQNSILGDDEHNDLFADMKFGTEDADAGLGQDGGQGDLDDLFQDNDHENDGYFNETQEEEQGDLDNLFKDNYAENEGREDLDDLFKDNDEENNDLFDNEEEKEHGDLDDFFKDSNDDNNDLFEVEHEERQEYLDNVINDSDNKSDDHFNDREEEKQGDLDNVFNSIEDEQDESDAFEELDPTSQDDQRSESAGDLFEEDEPTPGSEADEFGEEHSLDNPIKSEDEPQHLDPDAGSVSDMGDNASEQDDQFDDLIETDDLDGGMEDNGPESDHEVDDPLAIDDFEEDTGDNGIEEDDQFEDPMAHEEVDPCMEDDGGQDFGNYDDPLANDDFEDNMPDTAEETYNDYQDQEMDGYDGGQVEDYGDYQADTTFDSGNMDHDGGGDAGYDGGGGAGYDGGYDAGYDGGGDAGYDGGGDAGYDGGYDAGQGYE